MESKIANKIIDKNYEEFDNAIIKFSKKGDLNVDECLVLLHYSIMLNRNLISLFITKKEEHFNILEELNTVSKSFKNLLDI